MKNKYHKPSIDRITRGSAEEVKKAHDILKFSTTTETNVHEN